MRPQGRESPALYEYPMLFYSGLVRRIQKRPPYTIDGDSILTDYAIATSYVPIAQRFSKMKAPGTPEIITSGYLLRLHRLE